MANDQITRKDIITDEAIKWGAEYVGYVEKAIAKNAEFVNALKVLNEQTSKGRLAKDVNEYIKAQENLKKSTESISVVWKEQIQLENQLIATKHKNELATEGTNRKLVEERLLLAQTNAAIRKETLDRLGLTGAYTKLNASRTEAKKKLLDLIAAENSSTQSIKRAQKEFDELDKKVKKADHAVGDFSKNVGNYKSAFQGLGSIMSAFGIAGGITGAIALGKEIFNITKEIQSLDLALKSVTETQENFEKQQAFLNDIAGKYGLEINNLTKQYTAFYVAAKDKLAADEIQELFENISRSGSALGLSNETLERSFMAVNQMLSKGVVASEELRGQLAESMPGAVQAMTQAVQKLHPELKNLTEKDLFDMIKKGEILAKDVLPETARQLALITGADKAEGMDTLAKSTNKFSNEWVDLVRTLQDSGVGGFFSDLFAGAMNGASGLLGLMKDLVQTSGQFRKQNLQEGKNIGEESFKTRFDIAKGSGSKDLEGNITSIQNAAKVELDRLTAKRDLIIKTNEDAGFFSKRTAEAVKKDTDILEKNIEAQLTIIDAGERKKAELRGQKTSASGKPVKPQKEAVLKSQIDDSAFRLAKQRLELSIAINEEIVKNEEETDEVRVSAAEERSKKEIALLKLVRDNELKVNKEKYNNAVEFAKAKLNNDLSVADTAEKRAKAQNDFAKNMNDAENLKLTKNDLIRIEEKYSYDKLQITKKTQEEIDKINEFDVKAYEAKLKLKETGIETQQNNALAEEEKRFAEELALIGDNDKKKQEAEEKHQEELFKIKKQFAIETAKLQISELENLLQAYKDQTEDTKESAQLIADIEKRISEAKLKLWENESSTYKSKEKEKTKTTKEQAEEILQISAQMTQALADLGNAFAERKIQNLEEEIDKNNEFYDKQIELAGDDERQKKELEKERELRNAETQKKINKEKEKQAKLDKAAAIAQILIQGALAQLTAANQIGPILGPILAGTLTAIALATAIATPIPKFKHGTKNAPKGLAIVGDGGRSEVITDASGNNPMLTPSTDTLVNLNRGDIVHKSIEDFNSFRLSQMKKLNPSHDIYNDDKLINEMKLTRRAIEKQKLSVNLSTQKIDVSHLIWAQNNRRW